MKIDVIAIDFDGTICNHEYPDIGFALPYAISYINEFKSMGARIMLWTMRSGESLQQAVEWCKNNGLTFDFVNENPEQLSWTNSHKQYAQLYIDDAAFGCPLKESAKYNSRPHVDWSVVGPKVLEMLKKQNEHV